MKIRLHQFLSKCGIFVSKQDLVDAVHSGQVLVGNAPMKDTAFEFNPAKKKVIYKGKILDLPADDKYFIFYKPTGFICSKLNSDERAHNKKSIYDFFADKLNAQDFGALHSIGRLDEDTSGLLIMTTDGKLSVKVTRPEGDIAKKYRATLDNPLKDEDKAKLEAGIDLTFEDSTGLRTIRTKPAKIERVNDWVYTITITEGKKRQVRNMFASVGCNVVALHRESIGSLKLGDFQMHVHKPGMFIKVEKDVIEKVFE